MVSRPQNTPQQHDRDVSPRKPLDLSDHTLRNELLREQVRERTQAQLTEAKAEQVSRADEQLLALSMLDDSPYSREFFEHGLASESFTLSRSGPTTLKAEPTGEGNFYGLIDLEGDQQAVTIVAKEDRHIGFRGNDAQQALAPWFGIRST